MRDIIFKKKKQSDDNFEKHHNLSENLKNKNQENCDFGKKKNKWLTCFIVLIIIILLPIMYYFYATKIPAGKSSQNISFEIFEGETTLDIGESLKQKKLIHNKYIFALYVYFKNINLIPGIYYLQSNMTLDQILDPVSKGNVQENKITIIEGWRREQIAQMLAENNIVEFDEFMKFSEGKEGYLFPDTYRISVNANAQEIVNKLTENFQNKTKDLSVTKNDLILASIVEREAKTNDERPQIAGLYTNRLNINMKLDADPTIQYAKGSWDPIKLSDYKDVNSPYNTYLYRGLPPGPICNPGLASIKAVLEPEKHKYFYFLHSKDNQIFFAETLEEHNQNKQKR